MNVRPLGSRVLIKLETAEKKTASGLYIPDSASEKATVASVVAIGESSDIKVKVGDKVMFDKYATAALKIDGEEYLIIKAEDLMAVIG